jgi:hypothetical protein
MWLAMRRLRQKIFVVLHLVLPLHHLACHGLQSSQAAVSWYGAKLRNAT